MLHIPKRDIQIEYDENPVFGGFRNFASNIRASEDKNDIMSDSFDYGFRLGWQICWKEQNDKFNKFNKQ